MLDFIGDLQRSHRCGELRASDAGQEGRSHGVGQQPPRLWQPAVRPTYATARALRRLFLRKRRARPRMKKAGSLRNEYVIAAVRHG